MDKSFISGLAGAVLGVFVGAPLMAIAQNTPAAPADSHTVTAPFSVKGGDGKVLMLVEEMDGGVKLTLDGGGDSKALISVSADSTQLGLRNTAQNLAGMIVRPEGSVINLIRDGRAVAMTSDAQLHGLAVTLGEDVNLVSLGVKDGKYPALRISEPSGTVVAHFGSSNNNNGAGVVMLANPGGVWTGGIVAKESGPAIVQINNEGGDALVTIGPSKSGDAGKISINSPDGSPAVEAGPIPGGQGLVCVHGPREKCFGTVTMPGGG